MKYIFILLTFMILSGCESNTKKAIQSKKNFPFYVGTYTNGESQGIYKYLLKNNGELKTVGLAARSQNPSFLAKSANGQFLLAVNEINSQNGLGTIESFLISGDSLKFLSRRSSGGVDPCFITVNKRGFVLTSNYTSGNVALHRLNKSGILTDLLDLQQHEGSGTTERQKGPHAHFTLFNPFVPDNIISVDLGTNELWFSHLDSLQQKLLPSDPKKLEMKPGAGPRHLVFHPNKKWLYVIDELDCTVSLVKKNDLGVYEKGTTISTLPTGYTKPNTSAEIKISSDGKFVYASNRGHNSIAIYKVNALDGSLQFMAHQPTHGDGPRNFELSPDENYLVVANQNTNNIVSFKRDKITGLLEYVNQIEAPSPVCLLF